MSKIKLTDGIIMSNGVILPFLELGTFQFNNFI